MPEHRLTAWMATLAVLAAAGCASAPVTPAAPTPVIETSDVDRFFRLYDANGGAPDAATLQRDYLDTGSEGLRTLARLRNVTGERMASAMAKSPDTFKAARACADTLPSVRARLTAALARLQALYPAMKAPPVTIAVGRGNPVGVGAPDTGIQIGLEALCAAGFLNPDLEERFVTVIAHEYVHVQQSAELQNKSDPTVLEMTLIEGIAEFVGEEIAGKVSYSHLPPLVAGREKEIGEAFLADIDKTDLSAWVYNTGSADPGDLGYWLGYRIARAYHARAADKQQAIADMLEMTDARAFLAASGWSPGD